MMGTGMELETRVGVGEAGFWKEITGWKLWLELLGKLVRWLKFARDGVAGQWW